MSLVKENEMLGLVGDIRIEMLAYDTVPIRTVLFVEKLFYMLGDLGLDLEILYCEFRLINCIGRIELLPMSLHR